MKTIVINTIPEFIPLVDNIKKDIYSSKYRIITEKVKTPDLEIFIGWSYGRDLVRVIFSTINREYYNSFLKSSEDNRINVGFLTINYSYLKHQKYPVVALEMFRKDNPEDIEKYKELITNFIIKAIYDHDKKED